MTKMTHPDSKQTIDVSPAQVGLYASAGWAIKPPPVKRAAKTAPAPSLKAENPKVNKA